MTECLPDFRDHPAMRFLYFRHGLFVKNRSDIIRACFRDQGGFCRCGRLGIASRDRLLSQGGCAAVAFFLAGLLQVAFTFWRAKLQRLDGQLQKIAAYKIHADRIVIGLDACLRHNSFAVMGDQILE